MTSLSARWRIQRLSVARTEKERAHPSSTPLHTLEITIAPKRPLNGCARPRQSPLRICGAQTLASWLLALSLSGCAELPVSPSGVPPATFLGRLSDTRTNVVGVLLAGWHTGLVIPADELGMLGDRLGHQLTEPYVSVGWGNRRFYMAAHPSSGDALAALFPSASVLWVQMLPNASGAVPPDGRIEWLCVDRGELWRLDSYLSDALQWQSGAPLDLGAGPLPESRFYGSGAHYDAFHNCNTWTVSALQFAGLPVSASGVLFAGQVARRVRPLASGDCGRMRRPIARTV